MKRTPDQLHAGISHPLAPVYLLSGDEPLQIMECQDAIRAAARTQGYQERIILDAESGIEWSSLRLQAQSLSLFSERRLIEIRLNDTKAGEAGAAAIAAYCNAPPTDTLLLITAGKLDNKTLQSGWPAVVDRVGVTVTVRPLKTEDLPAWIKRRLKSKGLEATGAALRLLAERVEGNLLAAAQDIDKLALSHTGKTIDEDDMVTAVGDSARYDLYALSDCALAGNAARAARMLRGLQDEGIEPILVSWTLSRELRALCVLAGGGRPEQTMPGYRLFPPREALLNGAIRRLGYTTIRGLLRQAARVDRVVKGADQGKVWDELTALCLRTAGWSGGTPRWT